MESCASGRWPTCAAWVPGNAWLKFCQFWCVRHRTDVVWPTVTRRKKCRVSGDLASAGLAGAREDLLLHRGFSGDAAREL